MQSSPHTIRYIQIYYVAIGVAQNRRHRTIRRGTVSAEMQKLLPDVNLKWDKETNQVTADWSEVCAYIRRLVRQSVPCSNISIIAIPRIEITRDDVV